MARLLALQPSTGGLRIPSGCTYIQYACTYGVGIFIPDYLHGRQSQNDGGTQADSTMPHASLMMHVVVIRAGCRGGQFRYSVALSAVSVMA